MRAVDATPSSRSIDAIEGLRVVGRPVGPLLAVATDESVAPTIAGSTRTTGPTRRATSAGCCSCSPALAQADGTTLPATTHLTITPVTEGVLPELLPALVAAADEVRGVPHVDADVRCCAELCRRSTAPVLDSETAFALLQGFGIGGGRRGAARPARAAARAHRGAARAAHRAAADRAARAVGGAARLARRAAASKNWVGLGAQRLHDDAHRRALRAIRAHERRDHALRAHAHQRPGDEPVLVVAGRVPRQDRDAVARRDERLDDAVVGEALRDDAACVAVDRLDAAQDAVERQPDGRRRSRSRRSTSAGVSWPSRPSGWPSGRAMSSGSRMSGRPSEPALAPARQHAGGVGDDDVVVGGEVGEVGQQRILVAADHRQARARRRPRCSKPGSSIWPPVGKMVSVTSPRGCSTNSSQTASARSIAIATSVAVSGERAARGGEREPAPGALGEGHAGLALEHLELLGHRRRGAVRGLRDGGDAAAFGELAQQTRGGGHPCSQTTHEVQLHC